VCTDKEIRVTSISMKIFHKHFIFEPTGNYGRKRVQKDYINVDIDFELDCGNKSTD